MADQTDVDDFLREVKGAILCHPVMWVKRLGAKSHGSGLNLTRKQMLERIERLTSRNYYRGPFDFEGAEVYSFGDEIEGIEAYVKLGLRQVGGKTVKYLEIHSFHKADRTINYAFN